MATKEKSTKGFVAEFFGEFFGSLVGEFFGGKSIARSIAQAVRGQQGQGVVAPVTQATAPGANNKLDPEAAEVLANLTNKEKKKEGRKRG